MLSELLTKYTLSDDLLCNLPSSWANVSQRKPECETLHIPKKKTDLLLLQNC